MKSRGMLITGLCVGVVVLTFGIYSARAVTTTVWEQGTQTEFAAGKPKNASISSKDEVTLSRELLPVDGDMSELRVWCLAQDSQGNMYAGTGEEGKIFKIAEDGEMSLLLDSPETDISSLIVDGDDNIYAGTSPDGIIYKIEPDRVPQTFFKSGEKYVWSLAFDNAGNLYAGTGMTGKLYKISPDGKGEVVCDSNDAHIKCVLSSGDHIYAGTEGSGIIYKISPDGGVFVLHDTSEREISSLAMDEDGNLYAATASGETAPGRAEQGGPGPPGLERERAERKSILYQITPDEVVTRIWKSPDPLAFSIIVDQKNLIVGTGDEGNLYSVTPDGDWASMADCEESQVLSLFKVNNGGEIWLATGNPGKIYKLSSGYVKAAELESEKHDASVTSKWGKISWEATQTDSAKVTLSTRTGNTEKPDDTWSEWSDEYTNPLGEEITSPPARFIQWLAKLSSTDGTTTPVLRRVSVAYLQRNLRPSVRSVAIADEKNGSEEPPGRPPGIEPRKEGLNRSERVPLRGNRVIRWQAADPNGDSLEYTVYFRGEGELNWKLLEEKLRGTSHPLDSESFPDGTYLVKVVATDSPSNPAEFARTHEKVSDAFDIDNTPPKVAEMQAVAAEEGRYVVTGKVEDASSYIKGIFYSVDGGDWKPIHPSDQIFDSGTENFAFPTEPLADGEHIIAVKAGDVAGNIGAAKTLVPAE